MAALYPLLLSLVAAWTAYGAYQEQYDQDLMRGRICMSVFLFGLALPAFLPALALPLLVAAFAGMGGVIFFSRRITAY